IPKNARDRRQITIVCPTTLVRVDSVETIGGAARNRIKRLDLPDLARFDIATVGVDRSIAFERCRDCTMVQFEKDGHVAERTVISVFYCGPVRRFDLAHPLANGYSDSGAARTEGTRWTGERKWSYSNRSVESTSSGSERL